MLAIQSKLLLDAGFRHGFSTRLGGVSESPFDTLNLGRTVGDSSAAVEENHARLATFVGYESVFETSQVHGANVVEIGESMSVMEARALEADALVTRIPGCAVGIRTADCIPILVADPESGEVAAVHAGWRGVVAGVAHEAIAKLDRNPERLLFAIGPHIRAASFEVGEDVAERIQAVAPHEPIILRGSKRTVDLTKALVAQLRGRGARAEHIDDVGGDTFLDAERFFSHRRDRERAGRHLSVIVGRPRQVAKAPDSSGVL